MSNIYTFFTLLTLIFFSSCNTQKESQEFLQPVKIFKLSYELSGTELKIPGTIVPKYESILSFKIPALIESIDVIEGTKLNKNEIIATLDKRDFLINLAVYEKKYNAAVQAHEANKAIVKNAILQFERVENLYKGGALPKKIYDEVLSKKLIAEANEKAALSVMEESYQGILNAQNNLKDTYLKAPYNCIISKKFLEKGNLATPGIPVVSVISQENPEVSISISKNEIDILKNSKNIFFIIDNKMFPLRLREIGPKPNLINLSYPVRLEFITISPKETDYNFDIGSNGIVSIESHNLTNNFKIPIEALFEKDGTRVWIYKDGKVNSKLVKIENLDNDGFVHISGNLKPGDTIVTAGVNYLFENQKVKPLENSDSNIGNQL